MNIDPRSDFFLQGSVRRIDDAFIEDAFCTSNANAFIVVSLPNGETIRLNLNRNTVVLNAFGQNMCLCCLQPGMRISAVISSSTTRSIPPQATAFLVAVQRNFRPPSSVTTGRIILVDFDNRYILTEDPNNIRNQTKFIITNTTTINNRFGAPVRFSALQPGQLARITHANFQTASIPPQTTAFHIQLL